MNRSKTEDIVEIRPIIKKQAIIRLTGDSPLIEHAWDEKAKMKMKALMGPMNEKGDRHGEAQA